MIIQHAAFSTSCTLEGMADGPEFDDLRRELSELKARVERLESQKANPQPM